LAALRQLRQSHPKLCGLLLTGHQPADSALETLQDPQYRFLPKPFENMELVSTVRGLLDQAG